MRLFYVLLLSLFTSAFAQAGAPVNLSQCRAHIAQVICLVDIPKDASPEQLPNNYDCSPGGEKYVSFFQGHFDRSNMLIQKMYCQVDKLMVVSTLRASATTIIGMSGTSLGIRRELLDRPMSFDQWLSWKDETSFGGSTRTGAASLRLIKYKSNRNTPEFALDFLLNHEFGHILDLTTGQAPRWFPLSWRNEQRPLAAQDFQNRNGLCFYTCTGSFLRADQVTEVFQGLMSSGFASLYAASGPRDDFADSFALYIMSEEQGLQLEVETPGGKFDLTSHFNSDKLASKREFFKNLLEKSAN
jgi:hypothetical protein